jgi:hypothetical protein
MSLTFLPIHSFLPPVTHTHTHKRWSVRGQTLFPFIFQLPPTRKRRAAIVCGFSEVEEGTCSGIHWERSCHFPEYVNGAPNNQHCPQSHTPRARGERWVHVAGRFLRGETSTEETRGRRAKLGESTGGHLNLDKSARLRSHIDTHHNAVLHLKKLHHIVAKLALCMIYTTIAIGKGGCRQHGTAISQVGTGRWSRREAATARK